MCTKFKYKDKSFIGKDSHLFLLVYLSQYRFLPIAGLTNIVFFYLECFHVSNCVLNASDVVLKSFFILLFYL